MLINHSITNTGDLTELTCEDAVIEEVSGPLKKQLDWDRTPSLDSFHLITLPLKGTQECLSVICFILENIALLSLSL